MAKTKKEEVVEEPLAKETVTVEAPKPQPKPVAKKKQKTIAQKLTGK